MDAKKHLNGLHVKDADERIVNVKYLVISHDSEVKTVVRFLKVFGHVISTDLNRTLLLTN